MMGNNNSYSVDIDWTTIIGASGAIAKQFR